MLTLALVPNNFKEKTMEKTEQNEHYIVLCGGAIINGPKFSDDSKEIAEFFEYVKKTNEEYGKDSMRVIDPRIKKASKNN